MRRNLLFVFLFFSVWNLFAQKIDGPANVRNKPGGMAIFALNNGVEVFVKGEETRNWYPIGVYCYVKPQALRNDTVFAGTILFDKNGNSVGRLYNPLVVKCTGADTDKTGIIISGYTYRSNIVFTNPTGVADSMAVAAKTTLPVANTPKEVLSTISPNSGTTIFKDSCMNRYKIIQNADSSSIMEISNCTIFEVPVLRNNRTQMAFVKQKQLIRRSTEFEQQDSEINMKIITGYLTSAPDTLNFDTRADEANFFGNMIRTVVYGVGKNPDEFTLYNSATLKKIMTYDSNLLAVRVPDEQTAGYFGFRMADYQLSGDGKMVLGTLSYTNGDSLIQEIRFYTKDEYTFKHVLRTTPVMEFNSGENPDFQILDDGESALINKVQSGSTQKDISGFSLKIKLEDDESGNQYVQDLNMLNGFFGGMPTKYLDVCVDAR